MTITVDNLLVSDIPTLSNAPIESESSTPGPSKETIGNDKND